MCLLLHVTGRPFRQFRNYFAEEENPEVADPLRGGMPPPRMKFWNEQSRSNSTSSRDVCEAPAMASPLADEAEERRIKPGEATRLAKLAEIEAASRAEREAEEAAKLASVRAKEEKVPQRSERGGRTRRERAESAHSYDDEIQEMVAKERRITLEPSR